MDLFDCYSGKNECEQLKQGVEKTQAQNLKPPKGAASVLVSSLAFDASRHQPMPLQDGRVKAAIPPPLRLHCGPRVSHDTFQPEIVTLLQTC
jgi:hypothetical protein